MAPTAEEEDRYIAEVLRPVQVFRGRDDGPTRHDHQIVDADAPARDRPRRRSTRTMIRDA